MPLDPAELRLYLVADPDLVRGSITDVVEAAIHGGITAVQVRAKRRTDREFEQIAGAVTELCRRHGVLSIVNDRLDVALAVGADGVHLGVDDLSVEAARRLGGSGFVIGYSPETDQQAAEAGARGVDYLGVGPVFGTTSKADAGPAIGVDLLRRRRELSGLPTIGIGGINAANAAQAMASGAEGVAVMSAVLRSSSPAAAVRRIAQAIDAARG